MGSQKANSKTGLESFHIAGLPPDFYYIPNFISTEEEASILQKIPAQRWTHLTHRRLQALPSTLTKNNTLLAAPLPTYLTNPILSRFKDLGIFDHTPHGQPNHVLVNEYRPGEGIMPHEDGDAYAHVVATVSLGAGLCLNVLPKPASNEVANGRIEAELEDGAREEVVRSQAVEEGRSQGGMWDLPTRIFQEPRSLLITTGRAYRVLMHGIESVEVDEELSGGTVANWGLLGQEGRDVIERDGGRNVRSTRVSLTYRDVIKVSTAASRVLGMGRR
ncbi:alkylated DNA repair protein alkB 6-like protein [Alternaria panax]|uniref:Alkylated DNA repair protein alkB 6-like protein n=1 Tax=Alternaria panax TaxID=48097 RepID=A0AAD4FMN5_9PLEO|nr:alkylated DNA repair protein alkB 6-like protein [Alternaria panax]